MRDDTAALQWASRMQNLANTVASLERTTGKVAGSLDGCDNFAQQAAGDGIPAEVLTGLGLGLSLIDVLTWIDEAPLTIHGAQEELRELNAAVEAGDLPSTAHSWRYQLIERLTTLESRIIELKGRFKRLHLELRRVCRVNSKH